MAVSLKHTTQATGTDQGNGDIHKAQWNEEHTLTLATGYILGRASAGTGAVEEIACTAAGRALLDDADASAQRTTLGLGTAATKNTGTSGANVPLMNAANQWSATQEFGDGSTSSYLRIRGAAGQDRQIAFTTNGSYRWTITCNTSAESGANAGSHLTVSRYDDTGAYVDDPWSINRTTGEMTAKSLLLTTKLAVSEGGTGSNTASGARSNLGLGTMATQAASSVAITGGSIAGITDLAVADGGTGASDAATARTNLGLKSGATTAITVSTTAPASPAVGDLWVDTN